MLLNILIFLLFLCPLIIIHELGHFLFARFFKVHVEVFSIGFGPTLLSFKRKTEYRLSLIPLGGYVRMYGEDITKKEEIDPQHRKESFAYQSKNARFWITLAGPLFNFIFAIFLYFALSLHGERVPALIFGYGSSNYIPRVEAGDLLYKVNGKIVSKIIDFPEGDKLIEKITIKRDNAEIDIAINMQGKEFLEQFNQLSLYLRNNQVVDPHGKVFTVADKSKEAIKSIDLSYPQDIIYLLNEEINLALPTQHNLIATLLQNKFYPIDLMVKEIKPNSAADQLLLPNDIIIKANQTTLFSFNQLRNIIDKNKGQEIELTILRQNKNKRVKIVPRLEKIDGENRYLIGVTSAVQMLPSIFLDVPSKGIGSSFVTAFQQFYSSLAKTADGLKKMITGKVSVKQIGGPISIGKVASDSFKLSLSYFLQLMALISVNLGLLNLIPIPILDGGHILFILLEIINRGQLSEKKMEVAQLIGIIIILFLTFLALINDISRLL